MKRNERQAIETNMSAIHATIKAENVGFVLQSVSNNLYADKFSFIREITSNGYDAHEEAGVLETKPIVIELVEKSNDSLSLVFRDYGKSMNQELFKKVYCSWWESTKRKTNKVLGLYGLGSKSPLAYSPQFYITLISPEEELAYKYLISSGEDAPKTFLIQKYEHEEEQGTIVEVPLKDISISSIASTVFKHTRYFRTVIYKGFDGYIDNVYNLVAAKHFYFHSSAPSCKTHIVMGPVMYDINEEYVEIENNRIPIGLKFDIGELEVTPSRESVQYKPHIVEKIEEKYALALKELVGLAKVDQFINTPVVEEFNTREHEVVLKDNSIRIPYRLAKKYGLKRPVPRQFANDTYTPLGILALNTIYPLCIHPARVVNYGTTGYKYVVRVAGLHTKMYYKEFKKSPDSLLLKDYESFTPEQLYNLGQNYSPKVVPVAREKAVSAMKTLLSVNTIPYTPIVDVEDLIHGDFGKEKETLLIERELIMSEVDNYCNVLYDYVLSLHNDISSIDFTETDVEYLQLKEASRKPRKVRSKDKFVVQLVTSRVRTKTSSKRHCTYSELMKLRGLVVMVTDQKKGFGFCHTLARLIKNFTAIVVSNTSATRLTKINPVKFKLMSTILNELESNPHKKPPQFLVNVINYSYAKQNLTNKAARFLNDSFVLKKLEPIMVDNYNRLYRISNLIKWYPSLEDNYTFFDFRKALTKWAKYHDWNWVTQDTINDVHLANSLANELDWLSSFKDADNLILVNLLKRLKIRVDTKWYQYETGLDCMKREEVYLLPYEIELFKQSERRLLYSYCIDQQAKNYRYRTLYTSYYFDYTLTQQFEGLMITREEFISTFNSLNSYESLYNLITQPYEQPNKQINTAS